MRPVIVLFAKAPVPGRVKTRLVPPLTPESAAALHAAFVRDLIERFLTFADASLELHTDISTDAWSEYNVSRRLQSEGDLGLKMVQALSRALASGHPRALILGSDAPMLPPEHAASLLHAAADVALGPSDDGGYWGIAARKVKPEMFEGVRWSGAHALEDTLRSVRACGLSAVLGPRCYDIDTPDDLDRLLREPGLPRHTAGQARSLIGYAGRMLHEGDPAPEIELLDDRGEAFRLSALRGQKVALYFYPKADTPGCTKESCEFRDQSPAFGQAGTVIVGISPDTPAAQAKFKKKYELPFILLADPDHKAAEAYGVWKEKSMYGKKYMGIERTTFLIGQDGRIERVFSKVKPEGHAAQVLAGAKA